MSKKYLSIEEAAELVGVSTTELNRLREKGSIRAFADRGTWKFKEEDVEKLRRSRQADSDPDVPLKSADEESSAELVFSDDDMLGNQPTIISKNTGSDSGSDSDVRLIFDDAMNVSESKEGSALEDSDSDVKLAGAAPSSKTDGGSDSDVKLVTEGDEATGSSVVGSGSDSDVRLVSSDSSGEVKLAGSGDSSVVSSSTEGGSTIDLTPAGDSSVLEDDSGISLATGSGIALASDSGISLERPNDSGISLAEGSSIVLTEDSGISLADQPPEVGKKGAPAAKGKGKGKEKPAPDDSADLSGTVPLMDIPLAESEDLFETQMEVPSLDDSSESSDFIDASHGGPTNVITLDDDEDDEYAVTSVKKRGAVPDTGEEDTFSGEIEAASDDAVDVSDEILGEDDELGEDVFGAEDEDFAGDVESGESLSELPVAARTAVAVEQEWGAGTFAGLALSSLLMIGCGTLMFDLVRNLWYTDTQNSNPIASFLLDTFKGL